MRKLVLLLALTSAGFAASTLYYARLLSLERARAAAPTPAPAPAATAPAVAAPAVASGSAATPQKIEAGAAHTQGFISGALVNAQPMSEADMKKMQAEFSKRFLEQLADPERREEILAERKMMMRNSYPRIDQVLGLTPEEYARYIELMALQQVDMQEASSRCMLDPNCQMEEFGRNLGADRNREINNLLGAERTQKLQTYMNTMGEREAVAQLRNRLPDTQRLGDSKAEALIQALAEERDAIHQEARQHGTDTSGFGFGAGMIFTSGDGSFEERYESAKENSQRLRERAAQHLNAEQLRAFNEMQDETLLSLRGALRNKDGDAGSVSFTTATAVPIGP